MRKLTKITSIFLICALALSSCKKDLQNLLENDLMFNMDANAFLQNQVQLHFVNANGSEQSIPSPKISIGGKDANLVFDINGGKDIKAEGQFAKMVVSPGNPLPAETPAIFKVRAEAPGFLPYERELSISQLDSFMTYTLEMIEVQNAPEGFRYTAQDGISSTKAVKIGQFDNQKFSAVVELPANAAFRDQNGNTLGVRSLEIYQFDGNKDAIAAQIPYLIPSYNDQVNFKGGMEDISFFPIGYTQLKVNGLNEHVFFDKPVQVAMSIPQGTTDKLSGDILKAGDPMQVFQWDELNRNWRFVEDIQLQAGPAGDLVANATVGSTEVIAILSNPPLERITGRTCSRPLGLLFKRASNVNTKHFVMVVDASDPTKVFDYAAGVIVANNTTFNFTRRLPTNKSFKVIVYEFETYSGRGREITTSQIFSACSFSTASRLTLNVNPPTVNNNPIVRFELDTYCQTSRLFYYHEGRIEYRVSGSNGAWNDLGLAKRSGSTITEILRVRPGTTPPPNLPPSATPSYSFLETDRLVNGTTYQFRVTISGRSRTSNRTVTKEFIKTRIFNTTEFVNRNGTSPVNYDYKLFNRGYWLPSADNSPNQDPCSYWGY